jgi:small subunit ribosomal protein S17
MADEIQNTENAEIEETPDETPAEDVVEETAPESEEPAAVAEPVAEEEEPADAVPAEEPTDEPVEEVPAEEPEPLVAEAGDVVDEAAADEPAGDDAPADAVVETEEAPAEPAAVSGPKPKRKHIPRSERSKKTRPKRVASAERKKITRLPKPEHDRGRRQERQGTVVSAGADKTIVVRVDVVKLHPRYKKVVKRSTRLHAHDEQNEAKLGDVVRIIETRPISRMKRWRLQEIVEAAK